METQLTNLQQATYILMTNAQALDQSITSMVRDGANRADAREAKRAIALLSESLASVSGQLRLLNKDIFALQPGEAQS